ncbi:disease resistance protein RPP13-like [Mangifera indica]|uniref:disease resistance protein RPP13-like n=1 Tax=Mangifera indica TaxID=29780 RepID=UPI001CF96A34|nr:disease resistance protein RPP13-like [Mangifera indica]
MVDAVVSFVIQKLGDYIIQEAVFLREVRDEVQLLKNELEWMQCFIKDAEEKQVEDVMIRKWVSDIREIAYDTEDVLDKFMLKIDKEKTLSQKQSDLFTSIRKNFCIFYIGKKIHLYGIGKEIESLQKRITDLSRKREFYRLEDIGNRREGKSKNLERLKDLRRVTSFALDENIVGLEDDAKMLLGKLLQDEPRRLVVSIFGMGGLGKTTLAKKLYHNIDVLNKFKFRAWVSVSQDYKTEDLLRRIIKSFEIKINGMELEKMTGEDLERCLYKSLQGCSYLAVIDDVWQREAWESLKRAFPDDNSGSRVIITTRIKAVAERSDERIYVHKLRFLRPDESWKLFCEKVFRKSDVNKELGKLGREMVEKCRGLPLAVVVLGGLLSTKKPREWQAVRDHIWQHLRNDSIHISYLLTLSFNDLSYQLKLCFLYLGIFQEDSEFFIEKAIRLLVAEGFIREADDRVMEEVAKGNVDELINRSLIQIESIHRGRVETCRIHDLLRDLAIQKAKEVNFIDIYDGIHHPTCSPTPSASRRLVFYPKASFWFPHCNFLSRSLLLYHRDKNSFHEISIAVCTRLRLLRVLYVENYGGSVQLYSLPEEIGQLVHLKYLTIRITKISNLPSSIVNLRRLQTLDLYTHYRSLELPNGIGELQELRHLIGKFGGPLPIDSLTNLQTLKFISYEKWIKVHPEKLVNLRELHIHHYDAERREAFIFDSIAKLKNIRILSVELSSVHSFTSLQPLSHCPRLQDMTLDGKIEELLPDMYTILPNLESLSLRNSNLEEDPMPKLEKLPNLVSLELLVNSYHGKKMVCSKMGFSQLDNLDILELDELEEWRVEEGAMPMLKNLEIKPGNSKLRIPERLMSMAAPNSRYLTRCYFPFVF